MNAVTLVVIAVGALAAVMGCIAAAPDENDERASQVVGIDLPKGYRDWRLISVAHEKGDLNDLRAILGNDIAIETFRAGKNTFPDGAIIARLAWKYIPSEENNEAFGREQSFIAGDPTNVQFMFKDSQKYVSTGGWGFAQFTGGKLDGEAVHKSCFSCHTPASERDFVFTRYAQ